jgi:fatty-acyl-CoA synthase
LPELPLTAVGKIFKPALRWRAAQMILEGALAPLGEGGVKVTVEVGPHERHGTLARVTVSGADASGVSEKARKILGPYPVPFRVETSC